VERVRTYLQENRFTFPVVMGGTGDNYTLGGVYGVEGYPTNYLLGPDGRVLWRGVGFDEAALRKALSDAGLK